jgi:hypothetical protein
MGTKQRRVLEVQFNFRTDNLKATKLPPVLGEALILMLCFAKRTGRKPSLETYRSASRVTLHPSAVIALNVAIGSERCVRSARF